MNTPDARRTLLLEAEIAPTLYRQAKPIAIGIFIIMSFGLIDTFFVSLLGTESLAAMGFAMPVTFILMNILMGFGIAAATLIAKQLGSKQVTQAHFTGMSSLLLAALCITAIALAGYFSLNSLFTFLGASGEVLQQLIDYMQVIYLGIIFLTVPMVGNGIIRGSGDMKTPSIIMGVSGLINGILDPLLIFGYGPFPALGIQGAALATVIAWFVICFYAFYVLIYRDKLLQISRRCFMQCYTQSKSILYLALPAASSNLIVPLAGTILTALIATQGHEAVAAFAIGSRVEIFAMIIFMSLSAALTTFSGQNLGASQFHRVERAINLSLRFSLISALVLYALLALASSWIAGIFSEDARVIEITILFFLIVPASFPFQASILVIGGFLPVLHRPLDALLINICRLLVFSIPLGYVAISYAGIGWFFTAIIISNALAYVLALYILTTRMRSDGMRLSLRG